MVHGTQPKELIPGTNPFVRDAIFWEKKGNVDPQCGLCPRFCMIPNDKTGFCGTRYNIGGKLYAINYGLISSAHIDPYEKKPLYHFHPGKYVFSVGGYGCNMACRHCQNCEISQQKVIELSSKLEYQSPEALLTQCRQAGTDGVSFTYNEPTIWLEYAFDCCKLLKDNGFATSFVTNGYITEEALSAIGPLLDAANVDIKGHEDNTYGEISGVDNPESILARTDEMVNKWKIHVEVTTNVIPGYNYTEKTFLGIANWIVSKLGPMIPWHITRYHPAYHLNVPPTSLEVMLMGREIGRQAGLKYVYLGNVADPEGEGTSCHQCGRLVIERSGFSTNEMHLDKGKCTYCGNDTGIVM